MKLAITALAFAVYTIGVAAVYAGEGCHSACAEGYTYSQETGQCVKTSVSSGRRAERPRPRPGRRQGMI